MAVVSVARMERTLESKLNLITGGYSKLEQRKGMSLCGIRHCKEWRVPDCVCNGYFWSYGSVVWS